MFRRFGLALAISGLLAASIPSVVGAASAPLQLTLDVTCPANPGTGFVTIYFSITWTGGTGHWVSTSASGTIEDAGNTVIGTFTDPEQKVPASAGYLDLGGYGLGTPATPLSYSAAVQLYHGGGPSPDGAPFTFTGWCTPS